MLLTRWLISICLLAPISAQAQLPSIDYTVRLTADDTTSFDVSMRIRNAPDTFRLAMAAHPEYDDRFWRYVERPTVLGMKLGASIVREDSAVWRVASHGETLVHYRIRLPVNEQNQRGSWRPFFRSTGALTGDLHTFMYMIGAEKAPATIKVDVPSGWKIATALQSTTDPTVFRASSAEEVMESPILVGNLHTWSFTTSGVRHRVVYWPLPSATKFDTTVFVNRIRHITEQGTALFRGAPYREYVFLVQDGAYGALEHPNSVTLGAPSALLAEDQTELLEEAAHEYMHLWNLMRIRPVERTGLDYHPARETRGLWFSEGLSMYYADLLLRRGKIPTSDSTRLAHLSHLIEQYLGNSSYQHISPEEASLGAYRSSPGTFGDYSPSVHLQGEVIGAMVDLIIRDATNNTRSIDDVMRLMMQRYSGQRGFGGRDIELTVADVCGCDVKQFFDAHVRGTQPIDFNRYLRLAGLRSETKVGPALEGAGKPAIDLRIFAWMPPGEQRPRLLLIDPNSTWVRAGLHTDDQLVSVNGVAMNSWPEFRNVLRNLKMGETLRFEIVRAGKPTQVTVVVSGYDRPTVSVTPIRDASPKQRRIREAWITG
ncbi:MAG TPA: PDZ domain-containing protein [Gemmatimonadaceae bacterium]|nr:PDZ domain-containing protein [Gemmatimonadaceae bacterium]